MPQMIDVRKVTVGPRYLTARVRIAEGAPLYTDEDVDGTALVYELMPEIADHVCLGDAGETFRDAIPSTEVAHLLEHVTVELVARTGLAGAVSCGQTSAPADTDERTFDIQLDCPDDVLVVAALSSAAWILQWAYAGGGEPKPGIEPIVEGIVAMVESLPVPEQPAEEPAEEDAEAEAADAEAVEPEQVEEEAVAAEADAPSEDEVAAPADEPALAEDSEPVAPAAGETVAMEAIPEAESAPAPESEPEAQPDVEPQPVSDEAPATVALDAEPVARRRPRAPRASSDTFSVVPSGNESTLFSTPAAPAEGVSDSGDDGYNPQQS